MQVGLKTSCIVELDIRGHALTNAAGGGVSSILQMVRHSKTLEKLYLDEAPLPVKQLKGTDPVVSVDLSKQKLE
eukprot:1380011-Prymnesium_polylepis.1